MKKILIASISLTFLLIAGVICIDDLTTFAQTSINASANKAGVAAVVRGTVELTRTGETGNVIKNGASVYLGDKITTAADGRLQILLLDETVFTIGPNSSLVIDEFIYDPATGDGKVKTKIVKGTFRFVTGKIAHKKPTQMSVDLPIGTIGVRGTIVAGQSEGMRSLVILLGPGAENNIGSKVGAIMLSNAVNGQIQEVLINRAGYGSIIEGAETPPLPAFQVPQEQIQSILNSLLLTPGNQSGGASGSGSSNSSSNSVADMESTSDASGEDTSATLNNANDVTDLTNNQNQITDETSPASQRTNTSGSANSSRDGGSSQGGHSITG